MEIPENNAATPLMYITKREYLKTLATPKTKKTMLLAKIVALVCVLIMVIGYLVAINTSIEEIPILRIAMEDADDFDEAKERLEDLVEEMEDDMDYYEDEFEDLLSKKEQKQLDKIVDIMKDCAKNASISNMKRLAKNMSNLTDDMSEIQDLKDATADLDEAIEILNIISIVLLVFMIVALFFTVLGALCKANGLVVVGAIFTTLFCILFCGVLFVILNLAAHVALIYLQGQGKKEFKAYRKGTLNA